MIPENFIAFDGDGKKIKLIFSGKSGGEGAIFNIEGERDLCAKVFFKTKAGDELHEKILTMIRYPPGGNLTKPGERISSSSIAWPSSPLYTFNKGRSEFIGFIMPGINTELFRESHIYYDTEDRLKNLGGAFTWQYLMTAAYNISYVVSAIHEIGHCVGDFSQRNVLIARTAAVSFIDCDSFQISDPERERTFHTKVGTGEFLPPELIGRNFRQENINRHYSDLYALGVMIFRLLMNGAHPYQAAGKAVWDLPTIEQKTIKGIFPYASADFRTVQPPRYAPPYNVIPPSVRELFSRCFMEGHKNPARRPSAEEWSRCLLSEAGKLKRCSHNPNHLYGSHLRECPWCRIAKTGQGDLFPYTKRDGSRIDQVSKEDEREEPAAIKSCKIRCKPSKFTFRSGAGEPAKGRLEIELSGCSPDSIAVATDSDWITGISEAGASGNRKYYEFGIDHSRIPGMEEGIRYVANLLIHTESGTGKVPVEIKLTPGPLLRTGEEKIFLRKIDPNKQESHIFSIENGGKGILTGTIRTDRDWLQVTPGSFSVSDVQEFRLNIKPDRSVRPLIHGNIHIKTNGGDAVIPVFASLA